MIGILAGMIAILSISIHKTRKERVLLEEGIYKLKSVNRINGLINKGKIKRIYIYDGWMGHFTKKIGELFGDRVDVIVIKRSEKAINDIEFCEDDYILFYENVIYDLEFATILIEKAKRSNVFVKVLTEDIFC